MNNTWLFVNSYLIFIIWVLVFLYFIYLKKHKQSIKLLISSALILVIIFLMKEFYLMPRPFSLEGKSPSSSLNMFSSFPSLHAAWAFMLATSAVKVFKRVSFEFLAILIAVFFSIFRVLASSHSYLDIGFGALIGIFVTTYVFEAIDI